MEQLRHFVCEDDLEWSAYSPRAGGIGVIELAGNIACRGGIIIQVTKTLVVFADGLDEDPFVQTDSYAYNAWVRGREKILRYDNAHRHRGHVDEYHKHTFDWTTGRETSCVCTGLAGLPTLGTVIREVEDWYSKMLEDLPQKDDCGSLDGLRDPETLELKPGP